MLLGTGPSGHGRIAMVLLVSDRGNENRLGGESLLLLKNIECAPVLLQRRVPRLRWSRSTALGDQPTPTISGAVVQVRRGRAAGGGQDGVVRRGTGMLDGACQLKLGPASGWFLHVRSMRRVCSRATREEQTHMNLDVYHFGDVWRRRWHQVARMLQLAHSPSCIIRMCKDRRSSFPKPSANRATLPPPNSANVRPPPMTEPRARPDPAPAVCVRAGSLHTLGLVGVRRPFATAG